MQVKLRKILVSTERVVYGITIPLAIGLKFEGTYFSVKESNGNLILMSGASPNQTQAELKKYQFEDCKI